jgi:hypothetical protein
MPEEYHDLFVKMLAQLVGLETETRIVHDLPTVTRRRT